jgi:hypothetical protein
MRQRHIGLGQRLTWLFVEEVDGSILLIREFGKEGDGLLGGVDLEETPQPKLGLQLFKDGRQAIQLWVRIPSRPLHLKNPIFLVLTMTCNYFASLSSRGLQ